jgi:hypothetical protein
VHDGTDGDVAQRQGVAGADFGALAGLEPVADLDALGGEDVALLAVVVVQQQDAAAAVGVVLDGRHLGGDAVLVAPEVDDPVLALVAATTVTGRLAAVVVAATRRRLLLDQRLLGGRLGDRRKVGNGLEPAARTGRLALALRHGAQTSNSSMVSPSARVT